MPVANTPTTAMLSETEGGTAVVTKKKTKTKVGKKVSKKVTAAPAPSAATKKKVSKKVAAKSPKVAAKDRMFETASEIMNMSKIKVQRETDKAVEDDTFNNFRLGALFGRINSEGWHVDWGYESFAQLVEDRYKINYRKAMYLIGIYNDLVSAEVSWEHVKDIGWSKLKEFSSHLTPENVEEWVKRANSMNAEQLREYMRNLKKGGDAPKSDVTTVSFRVYPNQKDIIKAALQKAASEHATKSEAVALHDMCADYLSGTSGKGTVSSIEFVQAAGAEEILKACEAAGVELPGVDGHQPEVDLESVIANAAPMDVIAAFEKVFQSDGATVSLEMTEEFVEKYNVEVG